jgi:hypothetical protein
VHEVLALTELHQMASLVTDMDKAIAAAGNLR